MSQSVAHIVRVLNNNAVLVARDGIELVLASRGIGYGKKPGDGVEVESDQRKYVETSTDKVEFLKSLASLDPGLATASAGQLRSQQSSFPICTPRYTWSSQITYPSRFSEVELGTLSRISS